MAEYNITMRQKNSEGEYDTLYPATTGNQVSGIYTAEETLTEATATLFNLANNAIPNDIFEILSHAVIIGENGLVSIGGDSLYTVSSDFGTITRPSTGGTTTSVTFPCLIQPKLCFVFGTFIYQPDQSNYLIVVCKGYSKEIYFRGANNKNVEFSTLKYDANISENNVTITVDKDIVIPEYYSGDLYYFAIG